MAAGPGPGRGQGSGLEQGQERCPHCHRPFKRLRAHLPHCKAAPPPASGARTSLPAPASAPGPATAPKPPPGSAPKTRHRPAPAVAPGSGPSPGPRPTTGSPSGSGPGPGSKLRPAPASTQGPAPSSGPRPATGNPSGPGPGSKLRPAPASTPGPAPSPGTRPATGSPSGPGQGSKLRPAPASTPGPAPSSGPRQAPATAPDPGPAAPGSGSGPARPGGSSERQPRAVEPAVQDVATALDLLPEEVEDVPRRMESGVKVVIEKHRARVVREKRPGGRAGTAEGTEPGRAAHPQRGKTAPKPTHAEARGPGAGRNVPQSAEGGKSSLKTTKALPEPPEGRTSAGGLVQQEGTDRLVAGEEQHQEAGVGYNAPVSALQPKNLHLSATEGLGGHSEGTPKNELSSLERLGDSREQMARVAEPLLGTGRAPGLALHRDWLHCPKPQPTCSSQASGRSPRAGATALEWFPDLYPEGDGLRMLQGKRFREDVGITVKAPGSSFSEGQRGPISERPLMEVRLGELHTWISTCDFSPQGLLGTVQKAWNSYYAKYINVRRGGPSGVSMLLAGYCLLSYSWNYQHFKRYRWRKYH